VLVAVVLLRPRDDAPRTFPDLPRAFSSAVTVARGAPAVRRSGDVREVTLRMLRSTEDVWRRAFASAGLRYRDARFGGFLEDRSARPCADRDEDLTGLYCPDGEAIFLRRADFSRIGPELWAYVVAHEVGHHVQELRGTFDAVDGAIADRPADAGDLAALVEAQADCYAGVWAFAASAGGDAASVADAPRWFRRGRASGRPGGCHTFAGEP
jgi:predicted metalloprotease